MHTPGLGWCQCQAPKATEQSREHLGWAVLDFSLSSSLRPGAADTGSPLLWAT